MQGSLVFARRAVDHGAERGNASIYKMVEDAFNGCISESSRRQNADIALSAAHRRNSGVAAFSGERSIQADHAMANLIHSR
jgi:hypothetical protein